MPRYLLSTQALLDVAKQAGLPAQRWLEAAGARGIQSSDVHISAVSPMILTRAFRQAEQSPAHDAVRRACESLVKRFAQAGQVVPVTQEIADRWGELLEYELSYTNAAGESKLFDSHEKLVMATAIEGIDGRPFVLVSRRHPAHGALKPLGLQLEDPEDATP